MLNNTLKYFPFVEIYTASLIASRIGHSFESRNPKKTGFRVKPGMTKKRDRICFRYTAGRIMTADKAIDKYCV